MATSILILFTLPCQNNLKIKSSKFDYSFQFLYWCFIINACLLCTNLTAAKENFFAEALKMFESKKYEDARFMLERNIVFNPKDALSYLYLAKIYNHEKDQRKEGKGHCELKFNEIEWRLTHHHYRQSEFKMLSTTEILIHNILIYNN